ncbi:DUF2746 domain-containing protein [Micromonospora sp. NPDC048839]|uniref:DUF2746 domain-containing protein n=1 Tax=Micromonospora sp. NPDC048839 TaxID=3155641 RepID=UPI0033D8E36A
MSHPLSLALSMEPPVQAAIVTACGTVSVALIGVVVELLRRQHKRLGEVKAHAAAARDQVQNSHTTNLRDDIDRVLAGLDQVIETQRQHGKDIGGLREELRTERIERIDVERRLDNHLTAR